MVLRTLFPLTAFKNAPNPKFVQNLSRQLFFGVPIRGTQICQKFVENLRICPEIVVFQILNKFLTNLGPPDWNPEKQSSGQILDKFGVRGVFECCKGKKGSQKWCMFHACGGANRAPKSPLIMRVSLAKEKGAWNISKGLRAGKRSPPHDCSQTKKMPC